MIGPSKAAGRVMAALGFLALFLAARICAEVAPGMSEAALLSAKGAPSGKMLVTGRTVYWWPDMTAVTKDGVVVTVTTGHGTAQASAQPRSVAPAAAAKAPVQYTTNFGTHWQDESQYIVENICADLSEMYLYAKTGRAPRPGELSVEATFTSEFAYTVVVHTPSVPRIEAALAVRHNIFSADTYAPLLAAFAAKFGPLNPAEGIEIEGLADTLTEPTAQGIENASQNVSATLEKNFSDPRAHDEAALVLAAFTMRDSSGKFEQLLAELCRMSAHLAFSAMLRSGAPASIDGQIAHAAMLSLMNNQADSQAAIRDIPEAEPGASAWRAALAMHNTYDLHKYENLASPSLLEQFARFKVVLVSTGEGAAWADVAKMDDRIRNLPDWGRFATRAGFSVQMGHSLLEKIIPAELGELKSVMAMLGDSDLSDAAVIATLNTQPGHCIVVDRAGTAHVNVIDRGLWGAFVQRHLCQAIVADYDLLKNKWAVPDEARAFLEKADRDFWGLELYPFVRRQNATVEAYYRSAQDDEMAVVRATPQVVPAEVWNYVSYDTNFCPNYCPPPHPFINEWHRHNPPQGTAYNVYARLSHPSLNEQPDTLARLERLHAIAPWNRNVDFHLMRAKYGDHASGAQMIEIFRDVVGTDAYSCAAIAKAFASNETLYEAWMRRAAVLSPAYYYPLADHFKELKRDIDAVATYEAAFASDSNAVRIANNSSWVILYYETHGRSDDATKMADRSAEVYSALGLEAKAGLLEKRGDYDGALAIYSAIEERYDDNDQLFMFLVRMQAASPGGRYQERLNAVAVKRVTGGLVAVDLSDLRGPPPDGMQLTVTNEATQQAGLQVGDVVVAVHGYRVRDFHSYTTLRELKPGALDLVLWRGGVYLGLSASPKGNRFGINFADYHGK
jgi:hypothetical protein